MLSLIPILTLLFATIASSTVEIRNSWLENIISNYQSMPGNNQRLSPLLVPRNLQTNSTLTNYTKNCSAPCFNASQWPYSSPLKIKNYETKLFTFPNLNLTNASHPVTWTTTNIANLSTYNSNFTFTIKPLGLMLGIYNITFNLT